MAKFSKPYYPTAMEIITAIGGGDSYAAFRMLREKDPTTVRLFYEAGMTALKEKYQGTPFRLFRALADVRDARAITALQALSGHADAQVRVGLAFLNGDDIPNDSVAAVKWFRRAAKQGEIDGQYYLGEQLRRGEGVHRNYLQAYKWFDIAVSQHPGSTSKCYFLAGEAREFVAATLTQGEIATAQRLAREWKPTLAR